jgi:protein-S-isoprenylcysteine O-methyltransferase Ste14
MLTFAQISHKFAFCHRRGRCDNVQTDIRRWIELLWVGFLVVWGIGALLQKQTVRREPIRSRLFHLSLAVVAGVLLFDKNLRLAPLGGRFVPKGLAFAYIGLTLTFVGIAFAIWARVFIGGNWSGAVTVKKDHELVRTGPYGLVRHPIYSGALLALLGTAIVFRETRGLLAFGVAILAFWLKSRREEFFMTEQFGAEYAKYQEKVKRLIPFVW